MIRNEGFVKKEASIDDAGRRLDRILRKALPELPLSALHRLLRQGRVLVNGKAGRGKDRIPAGAVIELPPGTPAERAPHLLDAPLRRIEASEGSPPAQASSYSAGGLEAKLNILWEGSGLLVVNKPAGLAVHGGGAKHEDTLEKQVRAYLAGTLPPSLSFKPGPLHRLDKPTSGIVVFALNLEAAQWFSSLLREGKIRKRYLAILEGALEQNETWEDTLVRDKSAQKTFVAYGDKKETITKGHEALSRVMPLAKTTLNGRFFTYAQLEIETGRTHQIRAQAASRGHPLAGDRKYGGKPLLSGKPLRSGFFLHAAELELPKDAGRPELPRIIKAPLPKTFALAVQEF